MIERNPTGQKFFLPIAFRNYVKNKNLKLTATMPKFLYFVIKININKSDADCQYKIVEACHYYKHTSHTRSRPLLLALLVVTLCRMII